MQQQVLQLRPEQFLADYRIFSLVIATLFGILGPISLITGFPAALLAYQVHTIVLVCGPYVAIALVQFSPPSFLQGYDYMKKGMYEKSRTRSIISAYLSFGTMFLSVITTSLIACALMGFLSY